MATSQLPKQYPYPSPPDECIRCPIPTSPNPLSLPAPSAVNPPQERSHKVEGTSSHLTNANISATLDTSPCADLEISRSGERIARSKERCVTKCQEMSGLNATPHASIRPHCSDLHQVLQRVPWPCKECIPTGVRHPGKCLSFQLYNNNDKCDRMQQQCLQFSSIFSVAHRSVVTPHSQPPHEQGLTSRSRRPSCTIGPRRRESGTRIPQTKHDRSARWEG